MIQRLQPRGIPFQAVVVDEWFGRNGLLQQQFGSANNQFYSNVSAKTPLYLERPEVTYPMTKWGMPTKNLQVLEVKANKVYKLRQHRSNQSETISMRLNELSCLQA